MDPVEAMDCVVFCEAASFQYSFNPQDQAVYDISKLVFFGLVDASF